ncbi:hypothetical protein OESDEN_03845 [Oesophagostomum dentatum]|uniref:G-protein coupled receptors family 1 profile domain-containing protein n=1 Tax=Oesophagostomum dentatum TaxID=61180 RepID=A0A0B1TLD5_OESDE|nr:hypothetical protein OESDEN_03845 [Oesophagostomum dentatum]
MRIRWKIYNIYLTIIHYFVPMIILDTAYTMIAIKLMYMLMIVVACFSLCWFPLETYLLLNEIKPEINMWKYINVLFFCAHWLAMSNSCLNPIIYGLYNLLDKRVEEKRTKKAMEIDGSRNLHTFFYSPLLVPLNT